MAKKQFYDYEGKDILARLENESCIHAEVCVHGLPEVFDRHGRPWIEPDQADADRVAGVVMRCPTGALQFERRDGESESAPERNVCTVVQDGPLYLSGALELNLTEGGVREDTRIALCRCGHSRSKPFCDNSHREAAFEDDGSLGAAMLGQGEPSVGASGLSLTPAPDGPVLMRGPIEIRSADGASRQAGIKGALCRCGASHNKPYCDGSHGVIEFKAD